MQPLAILNIVGLSTSLLDHAPNLRSLESIAKLEPVLPAVTCSVQASMLTGQPVEKHGIVGNGWLHQDTQEIRFWHQSNKLVQAPAIWDNARAIDPAFSCMNSFWWFNMYSSADWAITPRPQYRANGRKIPDCWTHPSELRDTLQKELGRFPLFQFWGPGANIKSTQWIADATQLTWDKYQPTLSLVYLPHLDYGLQKLGPGHPDIAKHVREVDTVCGELISFFNQRGVRVLALSEYGIEPVVDAICPNRLLRQAGLLAWRTENGREYLDAGASKAFAICDHQVAHIHTRPEYLTQVRELFENTPGVADITHIEHSRAGQLTLVSTGNRWFAHDWWLDDAQMPDYQKTVDIHKKPGYDPRELYLGCPKWKMLTKLAGRKLGFANLLDVIATDTRTVKGSHGRVKDVPEQLRPVLLGAEPFGIADNSSIACTQIHDLALKIIFN